MTPFIYNLLTINKFVLSANELTGSILRQTATFFKNFAEKYSMRHVISSQKTLGQIDIANVDIDSTSRDDIPVILRGLQHIYTNKSLRETIFKILTELAPKQDGNEANVVSIDKGRPGAYSGST